MEKESLEARIARLEEEVRRLKGAMEVAEGEQEFAQRREKSSPPETGPKDMGRKIPSGQVKLRIIEEESRKETESVHRRVKSSPGIPSQVREKWLQLEAIIGERWLVWVGALVVAGGFGIFLKIAFERGWLNEMARFVLGLLGGFLIMGFAEFLYKKKFRSLAQGISGLGLIILYLTVFMAYRFYHMFGGATSFILFFAVTIGGMSTAMFHNAFPTAFLSVIGAFATPMMLVDPTSTVYYEPMLFSYLLVINLGVLYVSSVKRWRTLSFFSFICTVFYFGSWYLGEYTLSDFPLAAGFAAGYFIVFSLTSSLYSVIRKKTSNYDDVLLVILNPAIFFLIGYKMLIDRGTTGIAPYVPLVMAIYHFILAGVIRRVNGRDLILYGGFMGTAIGLLTLPVPMTVSSYWITVVWGIEGVTLIVAGAMMGRKALRTGGAAVLLLVVFRLFLIDSSMPYHVAEHHLLFLNLKFLALFLSSATFGLAALCFSRFEKIFPGERAYAGPLWGLFGISLFWITNVDLFYHFSTLTGVAGRMKWAYSTMLWSTFFLWLLLQGIFKKVETLRVFGLSLMGATAAKILLLDTPILYRYSHYFLFNLRFLSQSIFLLSIFIGAFFYGRRLREGDN